MCSCSVSYTHLDVYKRQAQVRIEHGGQVWVASGDYKLEDDGTCPPFEPVRCHTFITESTFGLPIYRWPSQPALFADINAWWAANAAAGRASVLYAYAFGKAQRLLHGVDASIGPIVVHGAVEQMCIRDRAGTMHAITAARAGADSSEERSKRRRIQISNVLSARNVQ